MFFLAIVEGTKVAVLIYVVAESGYSTGDLPEEAYLSLCFFVPDLLPSTLLCTLEFLARRKRLNEQLLKLDDLTGSNQMSSIPSGLFPLTPSEIKRNLSRMKKDRNDKLAEPFLANLRREEDGDPSFWTIDNEMMIGDSSGSVPDPSSTVNREYIF